MRIDLGVLAVMSGGTVGGLSNVAMGGDFWRGFTMGAVSAGLSFAGNVIASEMAINRTSVRLAKEAAQKILRAGTPVGTERVFDKDLIGKLAAKFHEILKARSDAMVGGKVDQTKFPEYDIIVRVQMKAGAVIGFDALLFKGSVATTSPNDFLAEAFDPATNGAGGVFNYPLAYLHVHPYTYEKGSPWVVGPDGADASAASGFLERYQSIPTVTGLSVSWYNVELYWGTYRFDGGNQWTPITRSSKDLWGW